jgi:hypothetical protein
MTFPGPLGVALLPSWKERLQADLYRNRRSPPPLERIDFASQRSRCFVPVTGARELMNRRGQVFWAL